MSRESGRDDQRTPRGAWKHRMHMSDSMAFFCPSLRSGMCLPTITFSARTADGSSLLTPMVFVRTPLSLPRADGGGTDEASETDSTVEGLRPSATRAARPPLRAAPGVATAADTSDSERAMVIEGRDREALAAAVRLWPAGGRREGVGLEGTGEG